MFKIIVIRQKFKLALLLIAALGVSAPAEAAIYFATYTGTVNGYYPQDVTGVFGTAGTPLSGVAYTAVYRIDDGLAGAPPYVGDMGSGLYGSYVRGGSNYATTVLPVTAVLTINGHSESFIGSTQAVSQQIRYSNADSILDYVDGTYGYLNIALYTYPDRVLATGDFRDPLEYDVPAYAAASSGGGFSVYQNDAQTYRYAFGSLSVSHLSITVGPTDVPEPDTWVLMLVGIALMATIRRRLIGR